MRDFNRHSNLYVMTVMLGFLGYNVLVLIYEKKKRKKKERNIEG